MTLTQLHHAFKAKKQVFFVPDLNRLCLASNEAQCLSKFTGYRVVKANLWLKVVFIIKELLK